MAGRPSTYTEQVGSEIARRLASGESMKAICAGSDMPGERTVYDWLEVHEEFRSRCARARVVQAQRYAEETIEIADTEEDAARARNRISARQWYAAKLAPKHFAERQTHEVTGVDGGPVRTSTTLDVSSLTEEQLRVLASVPVHRG